MASDEVNAFLSHLATDPQVSAPTQNLALVAVLFLKRMGVKNMINQCFCSPKILNFFWANNLPVS